MEECIICFDATTEFIFYSCAHKVCANCYPKLKKCPLCKTPIEIIVIQPTNQAIASEIGTYRMIMFISICLLFGAVILYFVSIFIIDI
jgi:hypothetical protein